jgi:hypothetical protein
VDRIHSACERLGKRLGDAGYALVVCSAHATSADAWAVRGFGAASKQRRGGVIAHCPSDSRKGLDAGQSIPEQWQALEVSARIVIRRVVNAESDVGMQSLPSAFLLCQIQALRESTDIIVTIGGKKGGAAEQLLAIARDRYPIVPLGCFGGIALQEYLRQEARLRAQVKKQELVNVLQSEEAIEHVDDLIQAARLTFGRRRIFLSYPWSRAQDADFVEAFLRRQPSVVREK